MEINDDTVVHWSDIQKYFQNILRELNEIDFGDEDRITERYFCDIVTMEAHKAWQMVYSRKKEVESPLIAERQGVVMTDQSRKRVLAPRGRPKGVKDKAPRKIKRVY